MVTVPLYSPAASPVVLALTVSVLAPLPEVGVTLSQGPPEIVEALAVNAPSVPDVAERETALTFTCTGSGAVLPVWVKKIKSGLTLSRKTCEEAGMQERINSDRKAETTVRLRKYIIVPPSARLDTTRLRRAR